MRRINEESIMLMCDEILEYYNVDHIEAKPSSRPKPRKVSFIKKLASQWTSEGIMISEEYYTDLEEILMWLEKKAVKPKTAKNLALSVGNLLNMIDRYQHVVSFFEMDDMLVRKFINNTKTIETNLEEISDKLKEQGKVTKA